MARLTGASAEDRLQLWDNTTGLRARLAYAAFLCITITHTHTHPYNKLRQSNTILSVYFKWMHCGQLWALGPDLQKPYGENALPLNVDFHCTRHLNTENYSCTGASSFQCDTEKCLPRIKEINTLIPAASRLLLLSELRWHRYGDASPLGHQGTIWIDSPRCWQDSSSERWIMAAVETAGPHVIQHQRNETAERAPQTEPCWLSAEATWQHGERPADSWGTGRCHGNRGRSRVTLVKDDKAATNWGKN